MSCVVKAASSGRQGDKHDQTYCNLRFYDWQHKRRDGA